MRKLFYPTVLALAGVFSSVSGDDLASLSDEFDDPSRLTEWARLFESEGWGANQIEAADIDSSLEGHLTLVPRTSSWHSDYKGALLYKTISGDFVVTMKVEPRNRTRDGAPGSSYSLAGIMARSPRLDLKSPADWTAGGENYIYLSMGMANDPGSYQFEVKTTRNSVSSLDVDAGAASALLQIARVGEYFLILRKLEGQDWEVYRRYHRPDMPEILQVGMTAYTDWGPVELMDPLTHNRSEIDGHNPDLNAAVDYFRFRRPRISSSLAGADFSDRLAMPDEQIVRLFGDRTNRDPLAAPEIGVAIADRSFLPDDGMQLEIESVPGYFYRIERSFDLVTWRTIRTEEALLDRLAFTVPTENGERAMYLRVVEE